MSDQSMIQARKLTKVYKRGGETLRVLDELDLDIDAGGFFALMGPSGSGKTTLLNLIGGLDDATSGQLIVDGTDVAELTGSELAQWRSDNVGFVFQGFNLIPVLTALENVMLPLGLTPLSKSEQRKQAEYALELVSMSDRMKHRPRQLSGGQEQRVAIARAIATDPKLILADEPTGDLDRDSANAVLELMTKLNQELGKTILMVTHDPLAAEFATNQIHLDKGRLAEVRERGAKSGAAAAGQLGGE
ncbi:putative ABC transporter ATP-binding protein [Planctomycetes bacterium Pla163]|uniref:Putative ABC transporter ATP-binding protein n=1 Tax=Rohdeia mirabilis TaxID=2528008 RepID=A0A518CW06_9BACT|nr:putative ABC transporter ATP-binding protein [Planctomycetes bacterium Pla163]